ncbi:MAG: hypothetical protein KDJ14_03505 [Xanthomonadales bacterium]|nr:hypothetical protein [Xanthomonadales bacterium]
MHVRRALSSKTPGTAQGMSSKACSSTRIRASTNLRIDKSRHESGHPPFPGAAP